MLNRLVKMKFSTVSKFVFLGGFCVLKTEINVRLYVTSPFQNGLQDGRSITPRVRANLPECPLCPGRKRAFRRKSCGFPQTPGKDTERLLLEVDD